MEDKEILEQEEFSLEDIIREFSDHPVEETPAEAVAPEGEPAEETREEEIPEDAAAEEASPEEEAPEEEEIPGEASAEEPAEQPEEAAQPAEEEMEEDSEEPGDAADLSDTVRLDTAEVLKGVARNAQPVEEDNTGADTVRLDTEQVEEALEAAKEDVKQWEPEYEQPMGNYVPPQPIVFPTRADSRDMKRKLVLGPEKKYYELTERGLGKLQLSMLLCLVVVALSAMSTILYAKGAVPDSRLRFMIFSQFLAMMVSALLGSFRLIQGVADLFKGRFTLNTLLVVTFLACAADGVFCLLQERVPCCAAFSLEVLLSLWSDYNRRHAELGQMDVLRKAGRLNGICAREDAWEGKKVLQRIPGQVSRCGRCRGSRRSAHR